MSLLIALCEVLSKATSMSSMSNGSLKAFQSVLFGFIILHAHSPNTLKGAHTFFFVSVLLQTSLCYWLRRQRRVLDRLKYSIGLCFVSVPGELCGCFCLSCRGFLQSLGNLRYNVIIQFQILEWSKDKNRSVKYLRKLCNLCPFSKLFLRNINALRFPFWYTGDTSKYVYWNK